MIASLEISSYGEPGRDEPRPRREEVRNESRAHVQIPVALRQQGRHAFTAEVSDISRSGFRVETFNPIAVDTYVWLRLPGLSPLAARVAWTAGLTHGCRFVDPLHPAVAEQVIAAYAAD